MGGEGGDEAGTPMKAPTKDPHVAMIDAQEKLHFIKLGVKHALARVKAKVERGEKLTADDQMMIKAIRQQAIDNTRRVQEQLFEELQAHGIDP